ncbi:MAG: discoidin domain-containing protein [Lachnospiraceae bacterium]|nr:discoidin domain-containing protein [Lachnospiraceae bacterium]
MKKTGIIIMTLMSLSAIVIWGIVWDMRSYAGETEYGEVTVVEAPDQTESITPARFVREAFVPVVPDGVNISELARFDANGFNDVYPPGKAKDGKTDGPSYWEGEADAYPNIFTAEFDEPHRIHAIKLLLCPKTIWGARKQTFSVEVSTDGGDYVGLLPEQTYDFDPLTGNELVLEFEEIRAMKLRLIFTGNTGAGGGQIAELEIYANE